MTDQEIIKGLRRIAAKEDRELQCMACGYEHNCSIHGCRIIKAAADRLEQIVSNLDTRNADQMFQEMGFCMKLCKEQMTVYESPVPMEGCFRVVLDSYGAYRAFVPINSPETILGMSFKEMRACMQWDKEASEHDNR